MNLLQFFLLFSWFILLLISIDAAKKQKFNALHFLVFIFVWVSLIIFVIFPNILNEIWEIVWLQRWADLLVYSSIIFLLYFSIVLLNKNENNSEFITGLIRELAIMNSKKIDIEWKIYLIMAAYNESKIINETIDDLISKWYEKIIVINDWSKDDTLIKLDKYKDNKNLIILSHPKNRWQWAALETWFEYIRRYWKNVDFVATFDADWQHDVDDLPNFFEVYDKDKTVDIVLGSRFVKKARANMSLSRRIILKLGVIFTFIISKIQLSDAHNWYRVIKTSTLDKLRITMDWMWHASDIVDQIQLKKLKYFEVPVNIKYTEYSMSKWQSSMNAINIAIQMIYKKIFK